MATTTITNPQIVKVQNTNTAKAPLVPYHENFVYKVPASTTIEFEVTTAGQALYYLKQAGYGLEVSLIAEFDGSGTTNYDLPGAVTLTAPAGKDIAFVPYRENFTQVIAGGDSLVIPVTTVGQVLYYIEQADLGLSVSYTADT